MAGALRQRLLEQRESFVFETVFSDPVGDKLAFLGSAVRAGYQVVLCFIGIASPATSDQRVAMRVSQGGHDVPLEKLVTRFPRTLANLKAAIPALPQVIIFDNEDLNYPFKRIPHSALRKCNFSRPIGQAESLTPTFVLVAAAPSSE
jgi:predicted ABC-type ATPase